jgi:biopolymer transport protein ExbB
MEQSLGFAHFIAQTDMVSKIVLILMLLLSLASWYLIVTKQLQHVQSQRRNRVFLTDFWRAESIDHAVLPAAGDAADNAFARLAREAIKAAHKNRQGKQSLAAAGGLNEYLTRVLRNGIEQETARAEHGLTLLASAGSSAPYVGLLGTVWGIYHALVAIGLAGQGTLDKVAGPVGEALIMTALGLAVAIPAVLAYNYFHRRNRVLIASLEAFAHDLITLLTVESDDTAAQHNAASDVVAARTRRAALAVN